MDKRKEKTINAIYNAFANLIRKKDYYDITIQDLLETSLLLQWQCLWQCCFWQAHARLLIQMNVPF